MVYMILRLSYLAHDKKCHRNKKLKGNTIMKKLVILLSLVAGLAYAGNRETAYREVCSKLSFDSAKNACMNDIKAFFYFEEGALGICSAMNFDSSKVNCLKVIGNKSYASYEVEACRNQNFDSSKESCLRNNGQPYNEPLPLPSCVSERELTRQLEDTLRDVQTGFSRSAERRLIELLRQLRSCNSPRGGYQRGGSMGPGDGRRH
jgi:hypothetical protein